MNTKRDHPKYRRIYEDYYKTKIPKGFHIHHIDGDCLNNDPLNLECLSPQDHALKHDHMRNFINSSHFASVKGGTTQGNKNKETGHWDKIKKLGNTPENISKRNEHCKKLGIGFYSEEIRKSKSELGKKLKEEKRGIFSKESRETQMKKFEDGTHPLLHLTSKERSENRKKYVESLNEDQLSKLKNQYSEIGRISRMFIWEVEHIDGRKLQIINLNEFCRENNLSPGTLRMTFAGDRKLHKNWKCKQLRKITKEEYITGKINGYNC